MGGADAIRNQLKTGDADVRIDGGSAGGQPPDKWSREEARALASTRGSVMSMSMVHARVQLQS